MTIRQKLEELGWPDGRSIFGALRDEVVSATSFLPSDAKMSQRLFCIYEGINHPPKCSVCGGDNKYSRKKLYEGNPFGGWSLYCSKDCVYKSEERDAKFISSMMANHGVRYSGESEELRNKGQDTLENRTGERFALRTEEGMRKFKNTMQSRHNGDFSMSSPSISKVIKKTNLNLYDDEFPIRTKTIKDKAIKSTIESVGVYPPSKSQDVSRKISTATISDESYGVLTDKDRLNRLFESCDKITFDVARVLGVHSATVNKYLRSHGIEPRTSNDSRGEREVASFLEEIGVHVVRQLTIEGKKADMVCQEKKIVIEYNGVYWHSSAFLPKLYHKERMDIFNKNGYRLINIWEDEWEDPIKRDIVKAKLRVVFGKTRGMKRVYARNTIVKEVKFKDVSTLLNTNHIQGAATGSLYIGCFDSSGDVVGCMIMSRKKGNAWELSRYCTNCLLVGGFSKMLSFFKKNNEWGSIVSFADKGVSDGGVYEKCGFSRVSETPPIMWYVKGPQRFRRERFMKYKLPKYFGEADMTKTEKEIMESNGYYQLFDAGLFKYVLENGK